MTRRKTFTIASALIATTLSGCALLMDYDPVAFRAEGTTINAVGVIDASTAENLAAALQENPNAKTLRLVSIPGSADDEASLSQLPQIIANAGLKIVVPSGGMVASGGTDMMLMASQRSIAPDACVGVHTWAEGLTGASGADVPRDDPAHQIYLDFYRAIGIDEAFYWYTLTAAPADDIHWMSPDEINQYGLSTLPVPASSETPAARAARCNAIE